MQLRPDFLDALEEVPGPDGQTRLVPKDDDIFRVFEGRIDVVDLNRPALVASRPFDGLLVSFLADSRIVEARYDDAGDLRLVIWEVDVEASTLAGAGGR